MKRLFFLLILPIFLGAGCFSSSSSGGSDGGVFKTVTAGEEFAQAIVVPTAAGIGSLATTNVLNMEMDPHDSNFLYIGTRSNGLLYSEDAAASWRQPREAAMREGTIFAVEVDPTDACRLYVAKGSRVYSSSDCMRTFESETYVDARGVNVVQIEVDWYDSETIWIGLGNGDVLRSDDAGNTWRTMLTTGQEVSDILISNDDSRQVLVSTFKTGVYKTVDKGSNWENIKGEIDDLKEADRVFQMRQTDDSGLVLLSSIYGLFVSTDFGSTWDALDLITSPGEVYIRAIGLDPTNKNIMYYAANGTFYRSNDAGVTWDTERLATTRVARDMLIDPSDSAVVYIATATASE